MAIVTNTFTTYEAVGIKEDLIDVVTNIAPVDTFVTSNTGSGKATQRYHEWLTDTLAAAAANTQIEGDQATATAITPAVRAGNYCQILRKTFSITDTNEAVDAVGGVTSTEYQKQLKLKELAKDIEYALVINATTATGASGTARQLKGIIGWIATNVTTGTGTGNEILTESMLNDNLQLVWAQGGEPSTILCGTFQKRKIDAWTTNTRNVGAAEKTLVSAIDVYKSSFGDLKVKMHRIINTTAPGTLVVLGDMSLWKKAWLRPIKSEKLARVGASTMTMIEAELTLESRQEKGAGKITGLTTS